MKKHKNGFTLAEVLITLVIIGIIAAMTIPSIIQNTNKQELYAKFKKNFSVINNALRLAQAEEGIINDNTIVFVPSSDGDRHYNTAKRLSKYLNTVKVCKNKNDTGCSDVYYDISYATEKEGTFDTNYYSAIALSDGSVYKIYQEESCNYTVQDCKQDVAGNCLKDEEGNNIPQTVTHTYCGVVYIDVNGAKAPNKFGEDNFAIRVNKDSVEMGTWSPNGGQIGRNILINSL